MEARKLDLVSLYLNQPVLQAHAISLQLTEIRHGTMTGELRLDPNTCSLDTWGDRGGCTKMAPQSHPVEATAMRTRDPKGHHRICWTVHSKGIPNARLSLIEYPDANLWYLSIASEMERTSVVPLFDAGLFATDAARPDTGQPHDVTEYHLQGDNTEITFHRGSDEETRLEYNGRAFSGRQLQREVTVLGLAASAMLEANPDRDTVWITVMIPDTRCPANARSIAVNSFAVVTTKRTSIAGPSGVSGQVDEYKVISPLSGNAW